MSAGGGGKLPSLESPELPPGGESSEWSSLGDD